MARRVGSESAEKAESRSDIAYRLYNLYVIVKRIAQARYISCSSALLNSIGLAGSLESRRNLTQYSQSTSERT